LYTLAATSGRKNTANEFILAITNELFPTIRPRSTSAMSGVFDPYHYFSLAGGSYTFFEKTALYLNKDLLQQGEQLAILHQTNEGLFQKNATIKDGQVILSKKDFNLKNTSKISRTALIRIRNQEKWAEILENHNTIDSLLPHVDTYRSSH